MLVLSYWRRWHGIDGAAVPIKYTEAIRWSCHKIVEYPERLLEELRSTYIWVI